MPQIIITYNDAGKYEVDYKDSVKAKDIIYASKMLDAIGSKMISNMLDTEKGEK
jgi:hypothetical protein